ncbi:aldehyde dehydrogenase (NADP(+)) [Bordetella genomosp. 8]|uniref:2,5-dioxovalerate dehydrogenase n=1 Tax=Bordetella genomosp. 8 TaxID=1416806 RepID=A0A1W6YIV2_9BORD|nr:aldehyde dehydrogenase (NADP(+)) [Bordetella genomosp. 8]ARP80924.1 aldehyde dehydrogenase (NADP(+)) [Bordetella genomosp. 8]
MSSPTTAITGEILIGQRAVDNGQRTLNAVNPATGETLSPSFAQAGAAEVDEACALAWEAFDAYRETSLEDRARFLEAIGDQIMKLGQPLVDRAVAETALPAARIEGERARTVGQLRLFAQVVRAGEFLDVRVDPAMPDRQPLPRPDLRLRNIALGPVAVFGASNFPLAFSVAGGDTAAALAAGCPVVVKGHPAHPGTGELVGRAIQAAARECGMPDGVFSLLLGGIETGASLVRDERIKAVGFTGSRAGGLALVDAASKRREPIPVFAEMSSINPVFLFPAALAARAEDLGKAFVASLTMGSGQFCTNPGIVVALESPDLDRFLKAADAALSAHVPSAMLTPGIHGAYEKGVKALESAEGVKVCGRGGAGEGPNRGRAALFSTSISNFLEQESLQQEVFGSSSMVVRCKSVDDMRDIAEHIEGQLTVTLHLDEADYELARGLVPVLERKAGRILANGWPTGVEVAHAMVHGGPFPATSDSRFTSVGTLAIRRFLRPVSYQALPAQLLPEALRPENLKRVPRLEDGKRLLP